jgi:hypothetical protein
LTHSSGAVCLEAQHLHIQPKLLPHHPGLVYRSG